VAYTILGGRLSGPVDLSIEGQLPVPLAAVMKNIEAAAARGLPGIPRLSRCGRHLAVVGGGPSIQEHVGELQAWCADGQGDIWAVNGAWNWCHENGIEATFFAVDPHPIVTTWARAKDGSLPDHSIISVCCDPGTFDLLEGRVDIAIRQGAEDLRGGSSTAGLAPHLAALMGYADVTFFGCESSYAMGRSHAYMHEPRDEELIIIADGCEHLTAPDFMMQARELATFIHEIGKTSPGFLSERSGGLLRALLNDLAIDRPMSIKWISQGMLDGLKHFKPAGQTAIADAVADAATPVAAPPVNIAAE
jgi:hypothetical protein